jgi:hypothetical protein
MIIVKLFYNMFDYLYCYIIINCSFCAYIFIFISSFVPLLSGHVKGEISFWPKADGGIPRIVNVSEAPAPKFQVNTNNSKLSIHALQLCAQGPQSHHYAKTFHLALQDQFIQAASQFCASKNSTVSP